MTVRQEPLPLRILALRTEITHLGAAIRLLRRAGLDNAIAELLLRRKRAELEALMVEAGKTMAAPAVPTRPTE